jgi:hypothetical protein
MGVIAVIKERRKSVLKNHVAYWTSVLVFLCIAMLLAGCSREIVQAVADLAPLQRKLEAEFGASNLEFDLHNGGTLGVTLVDSPANGLAWSKKAELAREVAESVCQTYGSMGAYDRVRVAFESRQEGIMGDSSGSVAFSFDRSELGCGDH